MVTDTFAGPVDYVVFAFPRGASVVPGLQRLLQAVQAGSVEVLDLEIIAASDDGAPERLALDDVAVQSGRTLPQFEGAFSGILDDDDLRHIVAELPVDHFAVAVVYEDRSLAATAAAWHHSGGTELFSGGVAVDDLASVVED